MLQITIRQLRYFDALVRHGHFGRAAEACAISQPALSMQIKEMEEVLGGVLLEHFWWGSVFLINVPIMLLLLAVGPVLLPEFRDPAAGRMDPVSALQSLAAVLAVIYGLKRVAEGGPGWVALIAVLAGVAVGDLRVS